MKPLLVLARIIFVGCLWSIIFTEGVRVIMLESWHFDIFWPPHWLHAWNLWSSGWVIDTPKEWAFILLIVAFIPMLITGWVALSLIPWEHLIWKTASYPVLLIKNLWKPIKIVTKQPVVVKKKSYKEIRPAGPRAPIYDYDDAVTPVAPAPMPHPMPSVSTADTTVAKDKTPAASDTFSHALFNLDDEDDDFDLDFDSFEKSDIFKIDSNKNKKEDKTSAKPSRSSQNKRFEFEDDDEDDEDYSRKPQRDEREYKNNRRRDEDDEDDYKPRRRSYDDEDDDNYRRKKDRRGDKSSESRDERRSENNKQERRQNNKKATKEKVSTAVVRQGNPVADILMQKGYDVISNISVKNTLIDFAGVADGKIYLCLVDKESGDWLADEERFNDEEPLWFSESSHRISPVRKVGLAAQAIKDRLESNNNVDFEIKPFVIVEMGNIINAEDMFEIWDELGVEVTRINRGSPKEIKLFSKSVEDADEKLNKNELDALKKQIRNIN